MKYSVVWRCLVLLVLSVAVWAKAGGPVFVGSEQCAGCHTTQYDDWTRSHHAHAMSVATADTVLGNFDNQTFVYADKVTRFYKKGDAFWVNTEGPYGKAVDYKISYTFGFDPLQQYVIAFPEGRYQVLSIAWDSRSQADGGQRWFHLYPSDNVDYKNPLHWTGPYQNWNSMCASCHVTGWEKNYQIDENRYASLWSESGVGCESCHGPGSAHIVAAKKGFGPDSDKQIYSLGNSNHGWLFSEGSPIAKYQGQQSEAEFSMCFGCHSRRTEIGDHSPKKPYLDAYTPVLLEQGLYHSDGQILDEVFVAGSFLQGAMHDQGVVCSDCHNVHSGQLKADLNGVCYQCHKPDVYAAETHHHHSVGSEASQCVSCHMPETTYMEVDPRRDHSIRIPDPALSQTTGAPNACTTCHEDKTDAWATTSVNAWGQQLAPVATTRGVSVYRKLAASMVGEEGTAMRLQDESLPGIVKATMLSRFVPASEAELQVLRAALTNKDPLVRLGAARSYNSVQPELRKAALWPLLADSIKSVRLDAFRALSVLPVASLSASEQKQFAKAQQEYMAAQALVGDRAGGWMNMAEIFLNQRDAKAAEEAYKKALVREPDYIPALLNLADLYRATGQQVEEKQLIQKALLKAPEDAGVHFAYGMALIREQRYPLALQALKDATQRAPSNGYYAYVYTVALVDLGRPDVALAYAQEVAEGLDSADTMLSFLQQAFTQAGDVDALAKIEKLQKKRR